MWFAQKEKHPLPGPLGAGETWKLCFQRSMALSYGAHLIELGGDACENPSYCHGL